MKNPSETIKYPTWIAYGDVVGWKKAIQESEVSSVTILNDIYDIIDSSVSISKKYLKGAAFSDSIVMYVRKSKSKEEGFKKLLIAVREISKAVFRKGFLIQWAITFGSMCHFRGKSGMPFQRGLIAGEGFINTFKLSQDSPAGRCLVQVSNNKSCFISKLNKQFILTRRDNSDIYEYFWMLSNPSMIPIFLANYKKLPNRRINKRRIQVIQKELKKIKILFKDIPKWYIN